jgi:putative transposase
MPRIGRVVAPNMPHHVVQRGHNRNAVFVDDCDYSYYLDTLGKWTRQLQVKVYAWCLMTNHVHLLLDPRDDIKSIGLLMKRLAGRQTRYVNKQKNRTGSLWDGRYKMSIVDSDQYFLQCCRYIELNPIKAKMVTCPKKYRWSSYRENAGLSSSEIVDRHGFAKLSGVRFEDYREYVAQGTPASESEFISQRLESNRLTGGDSFVKEIEFRTGIRLEFKRPGRPPMNKVIDQINPMIK